MVNSSSSTNSDVSTYLISHIAKWIVNRMLVRNSQCCFSHSAQQWHSATNQALTALCIGMSVCRAGKVDAFEPCLMVPSKSVAVLVVGTFWIPVAASHLLPCYASTISFSTITSSNALHIWYHIMHVKHSALTCKRLHFIHLDSPFSSLKILLLSNMQGLFKSALHFLLWKGQDSDI